MSTIDGVLGEILTAIVTPFREDGSVDYDRFRELARHLVDNGSDGLVVTGTTGESPTLSDDERFELYAAAVDAVGDRATVIAGTGTYSTAHSMHLTARAHELGVHGFLVVTPYYNKPPQRGIVEHFRAISEVSDRPIVAYNIPGARRHQHRAGDDGRAGRDPDREGGQAGQRRPRPGPPDRRARTRPLRRGRPAAACRSCGIGGAGGICVRSHIAGPEMKEMVRLYRAGDVDGARRIDEALSPLCELDDVAVNPIPIKTALALVGQDVGGFRLPMVPATDDELERVRDCLARAGLSVAAAAA